ncbi:YtzC family protein [Ectobacillus antri]|jgi:hypothetical protein|uniref:YtzC family protein n=1 Tax=Ectobacillus antri TaxID=2486280 RepID=A0ABT6H4Z5_9BACI|nr:YtzC family protein [Ectobacillus antri]MDG4656456.1 YtzC family protein [Ectobacillus antri]MDG5753506.1 YtzC family protein [Ectobacillus antri]
MTDRYSLDQCIHEAEEAMKYGHEQLELGMRQEHYNDMEYSDAQLQLEQAVIALEKMMDNANAEQRERIDRTLAQMRHLQHQMITTPH